MDINASIIDQRLGGIVQEHSDDIIEVAGPDEVRQRSLAFVLLCVTSFLGITIPEALELVTEGGNDQGIDALHLSEVDDGEFTVTIFQGKYSHKNLDGAANFPENAIKTAINLLGAIFDPQKQLTMNPRLTPRVEEVRSLIRDGYIPNVQMVFCNNGARWTEAAQGWIDQSGLATSQVQWLHYNHDNIVAVMQNTRSVNDDLRLKGAAIIENFNYRRVLVGKVAVSEIAELFNRNGDRLLERNIRRYLGRHANRVNSAIHNTLVDSDKQGNFYFFNNGITMTCTKLRHNALQGGDYQLKLENIQVINGGQTCKTIQQTLNERDMLHTFENAYVLLRLYELESDNDDLVKEITFATNSQNPVDLRDLHSNDQVQINLETGIESLGYRYRRYRENAAIEGDVITSATTAEAVMAVWRQCPHQSKFRRRELFGALYEEVFAGLNAAQAVLAVLIFRMAENERKRPNVLKPAPDYLPYASHFLAMLIGRKLLEREGLTVSGIDHRNIEHLKEVLEASSADFLREANITLNRALQGIYGDRRISLQQLAATFRRGDLLEFLL